MCVVHTNVLFMKGGIIKGNVFDSEDKRRVAVDLSGITPGSFDFHGHTNNTPFSTQDFSLLLYEAIEKIGVITYNKDVYIATIGDGWNESWSCLNKAGFRMFRLSLHMNP